MSRDLTHTQHTAPEQVETHDSNLKDAASLIQQVSVELAEMSHRTPTTKRSVSLSPRTSQAVEQVAGPGQFSAYVERALQRQLQRDHLSAFLTDMDATIGPANPADVRRVEALLSR